MRAMASDPERVAVSTLNQDCGLVRPGPGWWAWLGDRQALLALFAAVPAWAALGLTVGGRMHAVAGASAWVSFVLVQPVAEEIAFRGVVQGQLLRLSAARRVGPLTLANLGTTAGFVALHFLAQPPLWALAVALPSLVFGHLRERFGSVLPAVIVHAVYNAGFALTAWGIQH
jgi:membrane protease YdiL (CAAX protease family)